uniref:PX domain-containing protein n=1 Tax=Syphacia muris TaxID=451379 RepID=A0A0N5A813_9BILA
MALLDIDAFTPHLSSNPIISIPEYKISSCGKYAKYFIKVNVEPYTWTVERRYRDFVTFDEQRFKDRKVSFLPPKKFIGNMVKSIHLKSQSFQDPEFLDTRRLELEKYIRAVMELELWLLKKRRQHSMSRLLAYFLDFQEYVSFCLSYKFLF